jgi:hypothetical protein
MDGFSAQPTTRSASAPSTTAWRVDLEAHLVLHLSGFAVHFSPSANETCPACCMIVKHGRQAWLGCPAGVPLDLAPGELHDWVRQGAYAFLAALHAIEVSHAF